MKCPVCGAEAAEGQGLCPACGTALDRTTVYDPALVKAALAKSGKVPGLSESAKTGVEWMDTAAPDEDDGLAPASGPREELAARGLLSSILADPSAHDEGTSHR